MLKSALKRLVRRSDAVFLDGLLEPLELLGLAQLWFFALGHQLAPVSMTAYTPNAIIRPNQITIKPQPA